MTVLLAESVYDLMLIGPSQIFTEHSERVFMFSTKCEKNFHFKKGCFRNDI